jgi:hypothetical protein
VRKRSAAAAELQRPDGQDHWGIAFFKTPKQPHAGPVIANFKFGLQYQGFDTRDAEPEPP